MIDANAQLRARRGVYGLMIIANSEANAQVSYSYYPHKFATFTSKYLGSNLSFCSKNLARYEKALEFFHK